MDQVNQKALEELSAYKAKGCHMLVPCMDHIADVANGFRLIVTPVLLRPHPKDKDVYPHESSHYNAIGNDWKKYYEVGRDKKKVDVDPQSELVRISGQGLEKLAQTTNVIWDTPAIETDRTNKGRQVVYITGALRMPDGFSFYRVPDLYGMDLDIVKEQLDAQYPKDDQSWLRDRDYLQKKVNQTKLCISGAKNRVIRKILGIDNAYTVASLAKEFVAVRVIPWLDMNDQFTRELVIRSNVAQLAIANIFGGKPPAGQQIEEQHKPAIEYVGDIDPKLCLPDDNIMEAETTNGATHYAVNSDAPPFAMDPKPTAVESLRADFLNSDIPAQCRVLEKFASVKGFDTSAWLGKFKPPMALEALRPDLRVSLYDHLCGLGEKAGVAA